MAALGGAQLSPLERALLRMALVIPNVYTKHPRPAPSERAAILERIKCARDEGRATEVADESWLADLTRQIEAGAYGATKAGATKARENGLRLREREEEWERTRRERKWEDREKRRR